MLYQQLLMGKNPYFIKVGAATAFEVHRHPEIELSFCLDGAYDIICEKERYTLTSGDFMIVSPLAAHEIPGNTEPCLHITVEFGYSFLGDFFENFVTNDPNCRFFNGIQLASNPLYEELKELMEETASVHSSAPAFSELSIKGNLYKISALLLQLLYATRSAGAPTRKTADIQKIDKALGCIHDRYHESLTVEAVSAFCGYSQSNFCKVFKAITGDTFHNTLNRHRVEMASMLLRETDYAIEKIALQTGFADSKSFCRVFKKVTGQSAREYRKNLRVTNTNQGELYGTQTDLFI